MMLGCQLECQQYKGRKLRWAVQSFFYSIFCLGKLNFICQTKSYEANQQRFRLPSLLGRSWMGRTAIHHLVPISHSLHCHSLLWVIMWRSWITLGALWWRSSMVGAHWMSPGAEVSPPLVWGALRWTWIALWPTREHLRPLPWSFRVGNTPEVRALRSGTTTTLLGRSSRALRPNLAFKVCSHGLLIAMVSRWPTTPRLAGHPSSLFFLLSSSSLSPLLLTLLTLEFCIEVLLFEVVFGQLVTREGGMLFVQILPSATPTLTSHQTSLKLFCH